MLNSIDQLNLTRIANEEEINTWDAAEKAKSKCVNGKLAVLDLGSEVEVYIHPQGSSVVDPETEETKEVFDAYAIRSKKPVSYGKFINDAERQEYDEANLGEISAINRKGRQTPEDPEVLIHDEFIAWVKEGLHAIGF